MISWSELPRDAAESLVADLCEHAAQRFPARIDHPVIRELVINVLIHWHGGPFRNTAGDPVGGLKADTNRAALAWLREHGKIPAGSQEYDDLFAETVFNSRFDSAEIRAGMQALMRNRRVIDFLIVTQYLDMAELNGTPPVPAEIVERLRGRGRNLSRQFVHNILLDFYRQTVAAGQGAP
jgi:hypothetical protein